jgi:hypothetical protein
MCDCQEPRWVLVEHGLVCRGCGRSQRTDDPIWDTLRRIAREELDTRPPPAEPGGPDPAPPTPDA